jgi:hypothetical protein
MGNNHCISTIFFANHVIFATITSQQSLRPFLTLGALATFVLLGWHKNAGEDVLIAAQRRSLGYSMKIPDSPLIPQFS